MISRIKSVSLSLVEFSIWWHLYGESNDNDNDDIYLLICLLRGSLTHISSIINRYIEIFRSSLSEVRASIGPKMRGGPMGGFNQRPAPYTRGDRFGGMNRFSNNGRGSRNRGDSFHLSKYEGYRAGEYRNRDLLYNSRTDSLRMYLHVYNLLP